MTGWWRYYLTACAVTVVGCFAISGLRVSSDVPPELHHSYRPRGDGSLDQYDREITEFLLVPTDARRAVVMTTMADLVAEARGRVISPTLVYDRLIVLEKYIYDPHSRLQLADFFQILNENPEE